jgi:molecular chaperone HscA
MELRGLKEQQVEAERVIEATEQALAIDAGLLNEAERSALDGAIAALRSAAAGQDARAIKIQLEAFNRASNEFASRRMDKSIREALAGHKIDEIRI